MANSGNLYASTAFTPLRLAFLAFLNKTKCGYPRSAIMSAPRPRASAQDVRRPVALGPPRPTPYSGRTCECDEKTAASTVQAANSGTWIETHEPRISAFGLEPSALNFSVLRSAFFVRLRRCPAKNSVAPASARSWGQLTIRGMPHDSWDGFPTRRVQRVFQPVVHREVGQVSSIDQPYNTLARAGNPSQSRVFAQRDPARSAEPTATASRFKSPTKNPLASVFSFSTPSASAVRKKRKKR